MSDSSTDEVRRRRSPAQVYHEASTGLMAALAEIGISASSIQNLANSSQDYSAAVPVLLEWFPRVDYFPLAWSIVHALSASFAQEQAQYAFVEFFRQPPVVGDPDAPNDTERLTGQLRSAIGQALQKFAGPHLADELIELALDSSYGMHRSPIVEALAKTLDPRVPNILIALIGDSTVRPAAIEALGVLRHEPARRHIEVWAGDPHEYLRDTAKCALRRIDG